jgi:hypothetical protein
VRQATAVEVRLDAGKPARFAASAQSIDRFDRLRRKRGAIYLVGAIVASQLAGIRRMSDYNPSTATPHAGRVARIPSFPAPLTPMYGLGPFVSGRQPSPAGNEDRVRLRMRAIVN